MFGEEGIEELVVRSRHLSADELQQAIVQRTLEFSHGELQDDLTLLVVAL